MLRIRPRTAMLAGLAPVVALGPAVPSIPAATAATAAAARPGPTAVNSVSASAFKIVARNHFGLSGNASGYAVIIVTGRRHAWVLGGSNPGGQSMPIAALWDGSRADPAKLPAGLTGFISDASASGPGDVWAASQYGRYVLRWDGTRWSLAHKWRSGQISGVDAITSRDVWVFGTTTTGFGRMGTWHFDGRSWTVVRGRAHTIIRASSLSRHDIWAIARGKSSDSVLRFNGKSWKPVLTHEALVGVRAHDILALSNRDVWVAGDSTGKTGAGRLVLLHWNGRSWHRIETRVNGWAGRLAAGPHGSVLITATPLSLIGTGLVLQVSPFGKISSAAIQSPLGSGVSDVALAPNGLEVWATGGVLTRLGGDAAIWTFRLTPPARDLEPQE
jgi:hypothetical protein